MLLHAETSPNTYSSPKLKKLTAEQAKPFLVQHANRGDQGQKTCWNCCFRNQTTGQRKLPPASRSEGKTGKSCGASPVARSAFASEGKRYEENSRMRGSLAS